MVISTSNISSRPFFHSRSSPHDGTNPSFNSHVSDHFLITARTKHIEAQCGPIFQYGLGEAHIGILGHIEFQYGGSKIQDCTGLLGRNLGHGSWMYYIEIQYGLNISIWPSLHPRFFPESRAILDLASWIRHIEIQCVSIFQCGPCALLGFSQSNEILGFSVCAKKKIV